MKEGGGFKVGWRWGTGQGVLRRLVFFWGGGVFEGGDDFYGGGGV